MIPNHPDAKKLFDYVHNTPFHVLHSDILTGKVPTLHTTAFWIDVSTERPPNYESVLVYDGKEVSIAYWSGTRWETCWHLEEEAVHGVTHWAFKPEKPS